MDNTKFTDEELLQVTQVIARWLQPRGIRIGTLLIEKVGRDNVFQEINDDTPSLYDKKEFHFMFDKEGLDSRSLKILEIMLRSSGLGISNGKWNIFSDSLGFERKPDFEIAAFADKLTHMDISQAKLNGLSSSMVRA